MTVQPVPSDPTDQDQSKGAVEGDQAVPEAARGHVGLGLRLRREQSQSNQQFGEDADARPQRQAARQKGRLNREDSPT